MIIIIPLELTVNILYKYNSIYCQVNTPGRVLLAMENCSSVRTWDNSGISGRFGICHAGVWTADGPANWFGCFVAISGYGFALDSARKPSCCNQLAACRLRPGMNQGKDSVAETTPENVSVSLARSAQDHSTAKPDEVVQTPVPRLSRRAASRETNAYAVRAAEIVLAH
jgi:hypothetical protein